MWPPPFHSLGNQESLYKLTVYPDSGIVSNDDDPPLELCIRTFWKNAKVDWNGSEPLLWKTDQVPVWKSPDLFTVTVLDDGRIIY